MEVSAVELRYKMNDILKALDRNEKVTIRYRGKVKGTLSSAEPKTTQKVQEHPYFGMNADCNRSVVEEMDVLRRGRFDDI